MEYLVDKLAYAGIVIAAATFVGLFCYGVYLVIFEDWGE
jgi:hypothetical protein|tara:strand:- start:64 stop:180 length:117 start_codon:yes stop_codon:yes gene_type:complete